MASVLIVDDEPDIRVLLRRVLEADRLLVVVGEASSGEEAIRLWRELRPDAVILDQWLQNESGLETAALMLKEAPEQVIVLFSAFLDVALERQAASVGVRTCISKTSLARLPAALADALGPRSAGDVS